MVKWVWWKSLGQFTLERECFFFFPADYRRITRITRSAHFLDIYSFKQINGSTRSASYSWLRNGSYPRSWSWAAWRWSAGCPWPSRAVRLVAGNKCWVFKHRQSTSLTHSHTTHIKSTLWALSNTKCVHFTLTYSCHGRFSCQSWRSMKHYSLIFITITGNNLFHGRSTSLNVTTNG